MFNFRKYLLLFLLLYLISSNTFASMDSAVANYLENDKIALICTNESIKYILPDGSVANSNFNMTWNKI